ncbi:MAG: PSD1 and planctomycete cytochrome C domain-containing protein [Planctomycetes bacterium]|nr:PSD1 and planctomycete cytochrome C domain-containing protein [Planctomycetota bacterium]
MRALSFVLCCGAALATTLPARGSDDDAALRAEAERFFEQRIRPLLSEHCFECHGAKKQQGGLRLDGAEGLAKGTDSGPVVVAGKPDQSRLLEVLRYAPGDVQMPPKGKLADDDVAAVVRWIQMGADFPGAAKRQAGGGDASGPGMAGGAQGHWAFQPVQRPVPPEVANVSLPLAPIDRFIVAKLEASELKPASPADRRTLIRRLSFDLTGLPPSFEDVEAFASDPSPDAYVRLVDRLLASPAYGERWARYWLDVARYADTKGYLFEEDRNYAQAYTYRDWVIRAFNDDLPYDRFIQLQLAADRLTSDADAQHQAAMGFLTLGRRFLNNRHDIIDDRIDVVTRGLLGLTVTCARCHDHKYDPIPTADYYSLYGVFDSSDEPREGGHPLRLVDAPNPREPRIFLRGSHRNRGEQVPRQFLAVLAGDERRPFTDGSGRLELARAIADPANPLTARVLVNRVWRWHFGRGLVETPSDFGLRSDPPTHPGLLDWLAAEFVGVESRGSRVESQHSSTVERRPGSDPQPSTLNPQPLPWSLKRLHRAIVLSAVYQQSSLRPSSTLHPPSSPATPGDADSEPNLDFENRLLSHFPRRRLDFEAQRDALLAAAGRLDRTMYGPSVKIAEPPFPPRRSVYAFIDRQNLPGVFRAFDFAAPDVHSPGRFTTTVPQQALFLLNSPFAIEQAHFLANRPEVPAARSPAEQVQVLYRLAYGREPETEELSLAIAFLESTNATSPTSGEAHPNALPPLVQLAQVLLGSNEFVYID